jgi:UDP-N-acetylglucosamine 2-epimerase (non-hydrolysing)
MKVLFIFGTRPEAIKLAPLILRMKTDPYFEVYVCNAAQHREMLDQVLNMFQIDSDFDLNVMTPNQSLAQLTARAIEEIDAVLAQFKPDICIVQGDTTSVLCGSLVSFYHKVPVAHVEAGLRTNDKFQPFPEEVNRRITSHIVDIHFAPTMLARQNLLAEHICDSRISVTGNTVIDALRIIREKISAGNVDIDPCVKQLLERVDKFVLVTSHRRENFGDGILSICNAVKKIAERYADVDIIFPVHLNPHIQKPVHSLLDSYTNIHLLKPLDYVSFVALISESYLVLTDSGGVQEEAPSFGKPVLVMRETTERPEGVQAGISRLVGTDESEIYGSVCDLIDNEVQYASMSKAKNPYGDGKASERIVQYLKNWR